MGRGNWTVKVIVLPLRVRGGVKQGEEELFAHLRPHRNLTVLTGRQQWGDASKEILMDAGVYGSFVTLIICVLSHELMENKNRKMEKSRTHTPACTDTNQLLVLKLCMHDPVLQFRPYT